MDQPTASFGFLDMEAEIGDLDMRVLERPIRPHDTDLSRVRYQLFRG